MVQLSTDLAALYPRHLEHVKSLYRQAAERVDRQGVLIAAGTPKSAFLDDYTYPFKVNPHFKFWLPVTEVSDCFVLIRDNEKPRLLYYQPEDYWHKPAEDPSGFWVEHWQIEPITSLRDAHNLIGDPGSLAFIGEETNIAEDWLIDCVNDETMLNSLHFDRAYKTPYEMACLQLANISAVQGHQAAEETFRDGGSEFDIQHTYLSAIAHREQQTPYSSIVALNDHCAVLHYQHYEFLHYHEPDRHSMLIDAGASCQGYAADITRTYAYRDGLFADLVLAMNEAQLSIIEDIEIELKYSDLQEKMHLLLASILKHFSIVNMSPESMVETNTTFAFLPHGLGHFLGLQTHDVAGFQQSRKGETKPAPEKYPALRLTRPIENGQVFTIEPGLYFIPTLLSKLKQSTEAKDVNWQMIESLIPFGGIRIEDNIAIYNDKTVNMTREAFQQ